MRKIVILLALILAILSAGLFTVDERQNAVVYNQVSKSSKVYSPGLHFAWPVFERVTYIFMNRRTTAFDFQLKLLNKQNVELTTTVEWQVSNPQEYLTATLLMNHSGFNKALGERVLQAIESQDHLTSLSELNKKSSLLNQVYLVNGLGVRVNSVEAIALKIETTNASVTSAKVLPIKESAAIAESMIPNINQQAIESAYYKSQSIKTEAEIEAANMYQKIQVKNPRFYDYFRKLQIYKSSAKSKQEMPQLDDLYTR